MFNKMIDYKLCWIFCGDTEFLPFKLLNSGLVLLDLPKRLPNDHTTNTFICGGFSDKKINHITNIIRDNNQLPAYAHIKCFDRLNDLNNDDYADAYASTNYEFQNDFKTIVYGDPQLIHMFLDDKNYKSNLNMFSITDEYLPNVLTGYDIFVVEDEFLLDRVVTRLIFETNNIYLINFSTCIQPDLGKLNLEDVVNPNRIFENMEIII